MIVRDFNIEKKTDRRLRIRNGNSVRLLAGR